MSAQTKFQSQDQLLYSIALTVTNPPVLGHGESLSIMAFRQHSGFQDSKSVTRSPVTGLLSNCGIEHEFQVTGSCMLTVLIYKSCREQKISNVKCFFFFFVPRNLLLTAFFKAESASIEAARNPQLKR